MDHLDKRNGVVLQVICADKPTKKKGTWRAKKLEWEGRNRTHEPSASKLVVFSGGEGFTFLVHNEPHLNFIQMNSAIVEVESLNWRIDGPIGIWMVESKNW